MADIDQLTVEAWAHSDASRPEALQPLVSQWPPLESSFAAISTRGKAIFVFDISRLSPESVCFDERAFDGRFISPQVPR